MEVHKKAEPRFARPIKPLLPFLTKPLGMNSKGKLEDTLGSDND